MDIDWKERLAELTGRNDAAQPDVCRQSGREGVVYSTNPDYTYASSEEEEPETLAPPRQRLRASMERAGRSGKTVTLIRGFVGAEADLANLCRQLKTRCGIGGSSKDGEIILQGDVREKAVVILKSLGYTQTK